MRKTILLAVMLLVAAFSVTTDQSGSSSAQQPTMSAPAPTLAGLFRWRNRRKPAPEASQPASKPA